jgi:hypothetical protein
VLCGNGAGAGSARVIVRDINGARSRNIWLDDRADYLQMTLLRAADGNDGDERLALLRRIRGDDALQALVLDARTGTGRYVVPFNPQFEPIRLVAIPDMTGDGRPELALLGRNPASGVSKLQVRNSMSGELIGTVWFDTPNRPLGLAVLPDLNGNGIVELALLGDGGSDQVRRVVIKDTRSGATLSVLRFK